MSDRGFDERWARVGAAMARAAERSGRPAASVRLLAASKTVPAAVLSAAVTAGLTDLGENRVQEAAAKIPLVLPAPRWHLIGPLQSNKARRAVGLFDCIQTIDSERLALGLDRLVGELGRPTPLDVFVEVNVSGEATKHGVRPDEVAALVEVIRTRCPRLGARGLMTVGPQVASPDEARPAYRLLSQLADAVGLPERSMGMSGDFEVAIEEGATMIRVGSALFGARPPAEATRP